MANLLFIPTKPAQLNMAGALVREIGQGNNVVLLPVSDDLSRMTMTNIELLALPRPDIQIDETQISSFSSGIRSTIANVCKERLVRMIVTFGDMDNMLSLALEGGSRGDLPPLVCVNAGVRADGIEQWSENRRRVEPFGNWLFTIDEAGADHLRQEGARGEIHVVGDINESLNKLAIDDLAPKSTVLSELGFDGGFVFASVAQDENSQHPERLASILETVKKFSEENPVLFLIDLKACKALSAIDAQWEETLHRSHPNVRVRKGGIPIHDLAQLIKTAQLVFSDMVLARSLARLAGTLCVVPRQKGQWLASFFRGDSSFLVPPHGDKGRYIEEVLTCVRQNSGQSFSPSPVTSNPARAIVECLRLNPSQPGNSLAVTQILPSSHLS